ncbi:MAG: alanine racemase [Anaerolineae bacterium]
MINLADLLHATGGTLHGQPAARQFSAFLYDSRLLTSAAGAPLAPIFVAVKTEKGDGHDYIADAVARGASGVLCQRPPAQGAVPGVTIVIVPDTRAALLAYAGYILQRPGLTTVGITGSAGKTTAKELIAAVLACTGQPVFRNRGSINGRYGLSIAAGELQPQHTLAVLELAADSFDEIRDLAALTRPRVGVVTSISEAHLSTFGSLATIAAEKGRLLEALPDDGLAVLNADDAAALALADRTAAPVVSVGQHPAATLRIHDLVAGPDGLRFAVEDTKGWLASRLGGAVTPLTVTSRLLGVHHAPLLTAALAVGVWFGVTPAEALAALAEFQPLGGHLRPLAGQYGALLLDDTVNASPASMRAALDALALFEGRPLVAILGDMWDLGAAEADAHRSVGQYAARCTDWLLVKGLRAQAIATGAQQAGFPAERIFRAFTDADILRFVQDKLAAGVWTAPVILVKGDRPARLERVAGGLLAHPEQAGQVLVRQSAGWLQVRALAQNRPTWVEIDLEAVAGNVQHAQELVGPEVAVCAVLKADGYGHGAPMIARTAFNNGARMGAVACLAEAIALREAAIDAPILVLGYTPAWQARDTVRHDVTATVYDLDVARALSQAAADLNRRARVHVKVDTGMGRLGLLPDDAVPFVQALTELPGLLVEGIFTHFSTADSDDLRHRDHAAMQLTIFNRVLDELHAHGLHIPIVHAANSAATLHWPSSRFNMVRLGIALYGLPPSAAAPLPAGFRRVLSWKTQIAQVKTLPAGTPISYGNSYITPRTTRLAVAPVGYADGFRRAPAHWGHVLVRGQAAPIIGRVTMDQTMLDVTDIPGARQGDEVVLIGRQGAAEITVEEVAERLGTISYEVVAEILARVPRVV